MSAPISIGDASTDRSAAGTVENAREPARHGAEMRLEDATPRKQSGRQRTRKRSARSPIPRPLAVVVALAVAISPSPGMSETHRRTRAAQPGKSPQPKL
jgi:hypothetical protein